MGKRRRRFAFADTIQQIVGGFLLAGPFVVTGEVWTLAEGMTAYHALATVLIVFVVGYGALYKADDERDPDREAEVAGIPARFVSLMLVSFGSVVILAVAFAAPTTFGADLWTTLKAIAVSAIFSVVGAATADTVF